MPETSFPHMGCPPTRSMPSAAAHSITAALVLAMSVTGLASATAPNPANTARMALMGAPITTTSAIDTTLRSVLAVETMPRSSALRTTVGLRSLPTTTISGRACLRASAKEEPMRPRPTTATVGIRLRQLLLHRAEQPPHVSHHAVERGEVQRLRPVGKGLVRRRGDLDDQPVRAGRHRGQRHRTHQPPLARGLRGVDDHRQARQLPAPRPGTALQGEARRGLARAYAPLPQDHVAGALR